MAELQVLQVDAKNGKKGGDNFYKMDEASVITIREKLFNDFYALADAQMDAIWQLLEGFEDDQLSTTLELEGYEWEWRRKAAEQKADQINISDKEQQPKTGASTEQQQH